jgi:hypothetical protein
MAVGLTEWCERQKAEEPNTFRAPLLEYDLEHLLSIVLAGFFDHNFMLCRRCRFPRQVKEKEDPKRTYPLRVDVTMALIIGWESVYPCISEPVPPPSLHGLQ